MQGEKAEMVTMVTQEFMIVQKSQVMVLYRIIL